MKKPKVVDVKPGSNLEHEIIDVLQNATVIEIQEDTVALIEKIMKDAEGWTPGKSTMTETDHKAVVERLRNRFKKKE